ncbi:MAG: T9SS type A sorting domain-containing protein [Bacteroidales bacterium]|nr:T9SS type A sorting domain-containing protein [Bacteroidales bacterium]
MRKIYLVSLMMLVTVMAAIGQALPDNWTVVTSLITVTEETSTVNDGSSAMKVVFTGTANEDIRSESFAVTSGASFSYTLDVYDNDAAGRVRMAIIWSTGNDYQNIYSVDQAGWQTLTYSANVPAGATSAYILLRFYDVSASWDGDAELFIDNAVFSENSGANIILNPSFEDWSVPVIPEYTIAEIQGSADASPYVGDQVITGGIVTGVSATGYFIQDGAGAWNGIFVFNNTNTPVIGDDITIKGIVAEFNGKTEMTNITEYNVNSVDNELPLPVAVTTLGAAAEMYEGVLVSVADANCSNADAGFGEWTVDDGSGAININDLMFAYTPVAGNDYNVTGVVDFANAAFKIEPRSADDITDLGNPIQNAINHAIANSSLTVNPNPVEINHGEAAEFDVTIQYATFSPDLPAGYYVDAFITFSEALPEGISINIVHTGYGIDVTYEPAAGTTVLTLSQMLGVSPALLWGHSGLTDVWNLSISGLPIGEYEAQIVSLADDGTDGPFSTFELASDVLNVSVLQTIEEALALLPASSSLSIDPEYQSRTWGENADLEVVAVFPGEIAPILAEYYTDAYIQISPAPTDGFVVSIVYDDNNGGHAELGSFDVTAGTENIYLSELASVDRTLLSGHAGLQITWTVTIGTLAVGDYTITMSSVTNTEAGFGTGDFVLATDNAQVVIENETDPITIIQQPADLVVCQDVEAYLFVEAESEEIISYEWFLNSESTGILNDTIYVTTPGEYYCVLTTESATLTTETASFMISVPVVNLGPDAQYCNGYIAELNAGEFASYEWQDLSANATFTVTESGEYFVVVSDEYGCTASDTINILFILDWSFSLGEDVYLCPEAVITLESPVVGAYEWNTEETTASIEVETAGEYILTVVQGNCTESDTIVVIAAENPEAFDFGDELFACQGSELSIESPVAAEAYLWSTGAVTDEIVVTESGTYTLTIFNEAGCSASDDVVVNFVDFIIISLGDDIMACPGDSVVLDPAAGASWIWSDASELSTLTVGAAGVYSVTVTDSYGCTGSDEIEVAYRIAPAVNLGEDIVFCSGNMLELQAPVATEYVWSTGDTLQGIEVSVSGDYSVTITDEFGCHNSDTMNLTVLPSPLVDLGPDNTITEDQTIILGAYPGYTTYQWFDNSTSDYIVLNGLSLGVGEHIIWVRVTASNDCETYDEFTLTVTEGIGVDPVIAESVNVFPNPVNNILNVDFGLLNGNKNVSLFDATGRCILSINTTDNQTSLDCSGLADGMYTVSISSENEFVRKTVVKQ